MPFSLFSILSETLPTMQGDPFSSDSEDEMYICPDGENCTSSDVDSDNPEYDILLFIIFFFPVSVVLSTNCSVSLKLVMISKDPSIS